MAGRYYWLKLNENFFESDVVEWLEDHTYSCTLNCA